MSEFEKKNRDGSDTEKREGTHVEGVEIDSTAFNAEVDSLRLSLRGRKLTAAIAFVTGTGFTLFGSVIS